MMLILPHPHPPKNFESHLDNFGGSPFDVMPEAIRAKTSVEPTSPFNVQSRLLDKHSVLWNYLMAVLPPQERSNVECPDAQVHQSQGQKPEKLVKFLVQHDYIF